MPLAHRKGLRQARRRKSKAPYQGRFTLSFRKRAIKQWRFVRLDRNSSSGKSPIPVAEHSDMRAGISQQSAIACFNGRQRTASVVTLGFWSRSAASALPAQSTVPAVIGGEWAAPRIKDSRELGDQRPRKQTGWPSGNRGKNRDGVRERRQRGCRPPYKSGPTEQHGRRSRSSSPRANGTT